MNNESQPKPIDGAEKFDGNGERIYTQEEQEIVSYVQELNKKIIDHITSIGVTAPDKMLELFNSYASKKKQVFLEKLLEIDHNYGEIDPKTNKPYYSSSALFHVMNGSSAREESTEFDFPNFSVVDYMEKLYGEFVGEDPETTKSYS